MTRVLEPDPFLYKVVRVGSHPQGMISARTVAYDLAYGAAHAICEWHRSRGGISDRYVITGSSVPLQRTMASAKQADGTRLRGMRI